MSDNPNIDPDDVGHVGQAAARDVPHVMIVPSPQGGFIGIMHLGHRLHSFAGATEDRIRALIAKVGIGEFALPQDQANAVAEEAVNTTLSAHETANLLAAHSELAAEHLSLRGSASELQQQLAAATEERDALKTEVDRLQALVTALNTPAGPLPLIPGGEPGTTIGIQESTVQPEVGDPGPAKEA